MGSQEEDSHCDSRDRAGGEKAVQEARTMGSRISRALEYGLNG